jgi:competence protein ComFB
MDIHNANEDIVFNTVQKIFDEIQNSGNPDKYCLCYQCRTDTICFTLNRIEPHYIVSNRGFTRIDPTSIKSQQLEADITSLIYKGLRLVNHNQRPTAPHDGSNVPSHKINHPLFDIPTIAGRIFNGISFEPIVGIEVSLYCEGDLIQMRNNNWQNPFTMVASTPGAYSFWPAPITAETPEVTKEFQFSLRVKSPDYEPLSHFFSLSATSRFHTAHSYTLNRTYKLPDLYIFPPDNEEQEEQY